MSFEKVEKRDGGKKQVGIPWEPTTFIFRGYNPCFGDVKPSFSMVLGSKGTTYINTYLGLGGGFEYFFMFIPKMGKMNPF